MKVVTAISNQNDPGFFLLKLSCALHDLELVVLVCEEENYKGHWVKDNLLRNYLMQVDDSEIILFTDGYDSVLLSGEDELLDKFYSAKTDLLFSAETICFPVKSLSSLYPDTGSSFRYLNSGGFIGKASLIKEMLDKQVVIEEQEFIWSNQYAWTLRYLQNTGKMKIDSKCELFYTFYVNVSASLLPDQKDNDPEVYSKLFNEWFQKNFDLRNGRIFSKITNTWPCNAHFNGTSKSFLKYYMDIPNLLYSKLPGSNKIIFTHSTGSIPAGIEG